MINLKPSCLRTETATPWLTGLPAGLWGWDGYKHTHTITHVPIHTHWERCWATYTSHIPYLWYTDMAGPPVNVSYVNKEWRGIRGGSGPKLQFLYITRWSCFRGAANLTMITEGQAWPRMGWGSLSFPLCKSIFISVFISHTFTCATLQQWQTNSNTSLQAHFYYGGTRVDCEGTKSSIKWTELYISWLRRK